MMRNQSSSPLLWLSLALFTIPAASASAQTAATPANTTPAPAAPAKPGDTQSSNRASAYFHAAMADMYEEEAVNSGRPEFVQHAIEEYKAALNADPGSAPLYDGLADLYFRTGRARDAESTAREVIKNHPNDVDAHKLLGRIYLRQLGEQQNAVSSSSPSGNALDLAIAEFEKIVALKPNSVDDRMVLGQLYTVKHQSAKAEEQFKTAQEIEPESEEVVLNLSRVYSESGNLDQAAKVIEAVPENDRTARMESTLGATYDQLKRPKDAIAAYKRAQDLQPDDAQTLNALGQALMNDNQYDAALKTFKDLAQADPDDAGPLVQIAEIQRREGKYEDALATIRKARKKDPENLEAGYKEGMLLDILGRYDEAIATYSAMVDQTSHANGAYTAEEKNNRGIFLERLGSLYHEQNKTDQAVAVYQKMIDMGGDQATRGYQFQVDCYNDAKNFGKAIEVARAAVAAYPKNSDMKLMLAGELVDQGKSDEGLDMAKSLINNGDDDRSVYFALGNMYTRMRRWKEAEDVLEKATPLSTKKDDKLYLLFLKGALADRQKHVEQAEGFFRQALDLDPNNAMTLNYLGYMFADKGVRLPEALKLIRKAVDQEPMNGAYLDSLGWVYFKMGDYELAEENLRQAVDRDQTDPTVHDHLGDLYEKTGRIRLAAAQWEMSLTQYQKTPQLDVEPGDMAKVEHKLEGARVKLARQDSTTGVPKSE
ncbi:MAG TPA: tetratricopeptide repeat protein [Terracidiphilus sp.]|nr:tetratricopeptide repeat protein [Terracidiphilus sp.]